MPQERLLAGRAHASGHHVGHLGSLPLQHGGLICRDAPIAVHALSPPTNEGQASWARSARIHNDQAIATFRERSDGSDPGDIDLVPIPAGESREAHESRLDDGEEGGRSFISYAAVFASSAETNVAVYRA